jgi:hypothetical protein
MVVQIQTDAETAVSSGLLTNLAVRKAGNLDSLILTVAQKVVSSGWLTNLAVRRVVWMAPWYR